MNLMQLGCRAATLLAASLVLATPVRAQRVPPDALEAVLARLHARGIPARWCQKACPIAPGERQVTVNHIIPTPDMLYVELELYGRRPPDPDDVLTAWVERRALQLRHEDDRWTVTADESITTATTGATRAAFPDGLRACFVGLGYSGAPGEGSGEPS